MSDSKTTNQVASPDDRPCTCHPSEALKPCRKKYAFHECAKVALIEAAEHVCAFDWSDNDTDAYKAIQELMAAIERVRWAV